MARITEFFDDDSASRPHPTEVECGWRVVIGDDGTRYLQLSTYGSSERKLEKKVSQTIQMDAERASQLRAILESVFGAQEVAK